MRQSWTMPSCPRATRFPSGENTGHDMLTRGVDATSCGSVPRTSQSWKVPSRSHTPNRPSGQKAKFGAPSRAIVVPFYWQLAAELWFRAISFQPENVNGAGCLCDHGNEFSAPATVPARAFGIRARCLVLARTEQSQSWRRSDPCRVEKAGLRRATIGCSPPCWKLPARPRLCRR